MVNAVHPNCFPSLYKISQEKHALLPTSITANETSAYVDLNDLVQTTAQRLIKVANLEGSSNKLKLVCKWGFDGSSGHSQHKQKFSNAANTDEYLFLVAMVPLRLIDVATERQVWINPTSSSILYCRPMITGVGKALIVKFSIILRVLASGSHVDLDKFRVVLEDTKKLYIYTYIHT